MNINQENIKQHLIETMGEFLDSDYVQQEEILSGKCDPVKREETELHIRMAEAAMNEYLKTV